MMDMPALSEVDWTRNDRVRYLSGLLLSFDCNNDQWTVLMEAASFGQTEVVSKLLTIPDLELDAVNIRGQTAAEVAMNRSHPAIADHINVEIQVSNFPPSFIKVFSKTNL